MSRGIVLYAGFLALVFLCFFCIQIQAPAIERDLANRSTQVLAANHIPVTGVVFSGRDATLNGVRGPAEVGERARQLVDAVPGVRVVDVKITADSPPIVISDPPLDRQIQARLDATIAGRSVEFSAVNAESTELTPKGKALLDEIAIILAQSPAVSLDIQGHTDSFMEPSQSLLLSKRKADAVKDYLISKGIASARLTTTGFGSTKPIADNSTWTGRQRNRRIEFEAKGGK
jgi:outer membrane protein OmpA-like peptidoglycan-associated protein